MELRKGDRCPVCDEGKLNEVRKDQDFTYKGHVRKITNQIVYECPECGEAFQNKKDRKIIEKLLTDSRRNIDGLLTSDEIKAVRKEFGLTQVQFAKLLGVGKKNFARYETGQATQSQSMDKLLRILCKFPFTIKLFGGNWPVLKESKDIRVRATYLKSKRREYKLRQRGCDIECGFDYKKVG